MRKFYLKVIVFIGLYLTVVFAFLVLSAQEKWSMLIADATLSGEYAYEDFGAAEIVPYIRRVQEQGEHTKLVIGDSVCNQIFERYYDINDVYCISGTNQAISLAGQYILAEEFIKSHKEIKDIYLFLVMGSLATDYGVQLGYQYAVMPFVETETIDNLDKDTLAKIADIYGGIFCRKEVVEMIDASPLNMKLYLNLLVEKQRIFPAESGALISDETYKYLEKIYLLCEENEITLHLVPGPHADTERQHKLEGQIRDVLEANGDKLGLINYLDQIVYYPEWMFRDGTHFDEKKLEDNFFQELALTYLPNINTEQAGRSH